MKTIRIFRRHETPNAFVVDDLYRELADDLGLSEWSPVVWIGRLFVLDNDFGEHWFDNWDQREEYRAKYSITQEEAGRLLIVDPDRFQDGKDGPCHTPGFRRAFWVNVLESLELDAELLFEEAREFNRRDKAALDENPKDSDLKEEFIPDLEQRIAVWKKRLGEK